MAVVKFEILIPIHSVVKGKLKPWIFSKHHGYDPARFKKGDYIKLQLDTGDPYADTKMICKVEKILHCIGDYSVDAIVFISIETWPYIGEFEDVGELLEHNSWRKQLA